MGIRIFKKADIDAGKGYKAKAIITSDLSNKLSVAVVNAQDRSDTARNTRSDTVYYVLEGEIEIEKYGEKSVAGKGDILFVPRNVGYSIRGTFKAVLINSPPFNPEDEQKSGA